MVPGESPTRPAARSLRVLAVFLIGALGLAVTARASAEPGDAGADFPITVRSFVERNYTRFSKEPYREHGRTYAVISFDQVKSDSPLARAVNQVALYREFQKALATHGFHEPAPGAQPAVLLTVLYGRGWLHNPYLDQEVETASSDFGVPTYTASVEQLIRERSTPGYADKTISANAEKLFIAVIAWKFPASPKDKPQKIWRTVMIADDPDQDLNLIADKLLAAGAGYFDHPIEQEEVTISSRVATGHVEVGTPTVVDPAKPGK